MSRTLALMRAMAALVVCVGQAGRDGSGAASKRTVDVTGAITYSKEGVESGGRRTPWKEVRSIDEHAPDPAAVTAEYEARRAKWPDDVASHLALGAWARARGLADAAKREYEAVLALQPDNADARKALGWFRVAKEWKLAAEEFEERRRSAGAATNAGKLELARWCADHGCPDGEWKLLVELAVADPFDKGMIALVKPIVAQRQPETALLPPLSGRWRAALDRSKHHQLKVYAIEAIDFCKVDDKGFPFRNSGKELADYYGFDCVITACADGRVADVDDHFPDPPPGVAGKFDEANFVEIEHSPSESTDFAHIRQGSALVKVGDLVKAGQPIAHVGNSGASGSPHLHFTLMTSVSDESGSSQWISVPWRLRGFRLLRTGDVDCDVEVKAARVQEGWEMQFPEPGATSPPRR